MLFVKDANFVVFGDELLSKKQIGCLVKCITKAEKATDAGVRVVVIRDDGKPEKAMATVSPDSGAITINLVNTWKQSLANAKKCRTVSMVAMFHNMLLLNVLHEIHHLTALGMADAELTEEEKKKAEEDAEVWASETLDYLVQNEDLEPDHPANSKFLGKMVMEELKAETKWAAKQREMVEEHVYYQNAKSTLVAMSFKKYLRIASKNLNDIAWDKDTIIEGPDPIENQLIDLTLVAGQYQMHIPFRPAMAPAPEVHQEAQTEITQAVVPTPEAFFEPLQQPAGFASQFNPASFPMEDEAEVAAEVERRFGLGDSAPAVQQQVAPVAQPQPVAQAAPVTQMQHTPEQVKALMYNVFAKCYNLIFGQCQPTTKGFDLPQNVHIKAVKLTAEEMLYVKAVDCLDANGRWCARKPTNDGEIRGLIMKNMPIPYYKLYIEYGGHKVTRVLLPQNPQKMTDGQYSKRAIEAQNGAAIMYVKDGDTNAWLTKIVNGAFE